MRDFFGRLTNLLKPVLSPAGHKLSRLRPYRPLLEALEPRLALAPCFPGSSPFVRIGDAEIVEGDAGRNFAEFTVTFTQGRGGGTRTVDYATADGTATRADDDYRRISGTVRFAFGETMKRIQVPVLGDQ